MSQGLASLRGLRTAPSLDPAALSELRAELEPLLLAATGSRRE